MKMARTLREFIAYTIIMQTRSLKSSLRSDFTDLHVMRLLRDFAFCEHRDKSYQTPNSKSEAKQSTICFMLLQ